MTRNNQVIKNTKCPKCKKIGLIRYYSYTFDYQNIQGVRIRCKECNHFFKGKEAKKLSEQIDENHHKRRK